jgi:hypothetical protein
MAVRLTSGMTTGPALPRAPRALRLLLLLALSAGLALSGCSGSDDSPKAKAKTSASSRASASTSPSPTASPSAAREKPPAAPKAKRGKAGQKVFGRYVMQLWSYGLRTNDPKPLVSLSPKKKPCFGCKPYARSLQQRRKHGWTVDFPGLSVHKVTAKKVRDNTYVKAVVDIPESDTYKRDGSYRSTNPAHEGATFEMLVHFEKKGYRLLSFTVS